MFKDIINNRAHIHHLDGFYYKARGKAQTKPTLNIDRQSFAKTRSFPFFGIVWKRLVLSDSNCNAQIKDRDSRIGSKQVLSESCQERRRGLK